MDSGALAPAVGRGLQAEVGAAGRPRTSHQHMQLWGGVRGAAPCHTQHLQGPVCTPHPGHQPEQRPEESGGSCGGWWAVQPGACSASALESSSSSFKASHLKSVSRRLNPLGASHLCPMRLRPPPAPGLRGWVAALAALWGAPSSLAEAPPAPPPSPVPSARPQLHLLRRPPESCWGQRTHPASPCPQQEAVLLLLWFP